MQINTLLRQVHHMSHRTTTKLTTNWRIMQIISPTKIRYMQVTRFYSIGHSKLRHNHHTWTLHIYQNKRYASGAKRKWHYGLNSHHIQHLVSHPPHLFHTTLYPHHAMTINPNSLKLQRGFVPLDYFKFEQELL